MPGRGDHHRECNREPPYPEGPHPHALVDHPRPRDRDCVTHPGRSRRSLKERPETVADLKQYGIHPVSPEERIDTASAGGEPVFHVYGPITHFECRPVAECTRGRVRYQYQASGSSRFLRARKSSSASLTATSMPGG